jgi:hypothetical protein
LPDFDSFTFTISPKRVAQSMAAEGSSPQGLDELFDGHASVAN